MDKLRVWWIPQAGATEEDLHERSEYIVSLTIIGINLDNGSQIENNIEEKETTNLYRNSFEIQTTLKRYYTDCVNFWLNQKDVVNANEAYRRALEWDLVEAYKANGGYLYDPFSSNKEKLDKQITLDFLKQNCILLYGSKWEKHWSEYALS